MRTKDLKSLSETISTVVQPIDDRSKLLAEGYLNSLTEKARQVYSSVNEEKDEDEGEKEESPAEEKAEDKAEMIMKRLAAKALKRARKKAATNEEVELAEKAAPGYEDWASDPKVKASFKQQYGKDWKQVMYGRSWNMAKMDEEVELAEGDSAKRMRILRKGKPVKGAVKDFMDRSFKKKIYKNKTMFGGETPAVLGRARLKHAAMKEQVLAEAGYKRLMRLRKAAYKADLASRSSVLDPTDARSQGKKHSRLKRAAAERMAQVTASMARRGGASDDAVRGGGSLVGKSGKYTKKAGTLANQRGKALSNFRLVGDRGIARDTGVGSVKAMADRLQKKKPQMTPDQVAKKRKDQAGMREFSANVRKGTFRTPEDPVAAAREMRPRYNYLKRTGKLKTK
jgi:hypothetical protein